MSLYKSDYEKDKVGLFRRRRCCRSLNRQPAGVPGAVHARQVLSVDQSLLPKGGDLAAHGRRRLRGAPAASR